MLIPLGILDYPVSAAAAGSYDLLETEILTNNSTTSITLSNLNSTYGSTYQHFQIRSAIKYYESGGGAGSAWLKLRFNGSGSGYKTHYLQGNGSSVTSAALAPTDYAYFTYIFKPGQDWSAIVMDILDPFETTKNTTLRALSGGISSTDGTLISLHSGLWDNTAAVDSITLTWDGGNPAQEGTRWSLYGLKASA
jgi:hypothetical protein